MIDAVNATTIYANYSPVSKNIIYRVVETEYNGSVFWVPEMLGKLYGSMASINREKARHNAYKHAEAIVRSYAQRGVRARAVELSISEG